MRHALILLAAAALPVTASGQTMQGMPGMAMPAAKPKPSAPPEKALKPRPRKASPAHHSPPVRPASAAAAPPMDMSEPTPADSAMPGMTMPADPHAGHDMAAMDNMAPAASGTDLPAGNAPPPPVRHDRSADIFYGAPAMAEAEARMMGSHGGATYRQLSFNLAEYQPGRGHDAYRWDGEAWLGGDRDRLVVKSEGEGRTHERLDDAEVQALYSRAIDPYWNVQAGVRQAFRPGPDRPYAVLGIEGLAPYWFEVEGSLFLSGKGDLLARAEAWYDQRITQRLVLQPRAELNFAAQDVPENRIGAGLSDAEIGLRLRYEIRREFAPYIGVAWERRFGATARLNRAAGEGAGGIRFVSGIRFWF
jgi:copper resistance protein B